MKLNKFRSVGAFALCVLTLSAQQPPPDREHGPPPHGESDSYPGRMGPPPSDGGSRPLMQRRLHVGPPGKWWTDPEQTQWLGLTTEQQKKMDALFQQSRLRLIDLSASLQKEEAILDPLLDADHPDESKILQQIDHIAQARAELEKANARFLLGIRNVLTPEQWKKLETERPPSRFNRSN